jgi:recyclin-1
MSNFKRAPPSAAPRGSKSILTTLQATTMFDSKPTLPAEILVAILDYLPVSDQMRFARASRRLREMVYDDTRWVARLKAMGCWDEAEARWRFEEHMRMRREKEAAAAAALAAGTVGAGVLPGVAPGGAGLPPPRTSTTLFDAAEEEKERERRAKHVADVRDGFETLNVSGPAPPQVIKDPFQDPEALLGVIKNAKSIRGLARQEYGKIYGAVAPFYFDLVNARSHADPIIFKVYRDPERQAQMLANLQTFAKSDWSTGWQQREDKLHSMKSIFESAVLREFEQGYEYWDVDGRMRKYAHVLDVLNGATAGIELFIQKHPLFTDKEVLMNSMDCLNQAPADNITLEPSRMFFELLAKKVNEQADIMERIFPRPGNVFWPFLEKVREDLIMEYTTPLLDEAHERNLLSYLKAVSGLFEQTMRFFLTLSPPKGTTESMLEKARELALKIFEPHLDLYLQEELDYFIRHAESEVGDWEKKLSDQDASVESFYMASFNRQADKKDFLTSFKKVVMMPVTVLPTTLAFPLASPFGPRAPVSAASMNVSSLAAPSPQSSRPQSPGLGGMEPERKSTPLPAGLEAPTDELAAKAALMTSRLEGIKSLFSIEVALNLVHAAKSSLGRAAVFIALGGQAGGEAREQCEAMFVNLLRILGNRHVKPGFEKAVEHLSHYNPRDVVDHNKAGVAPLVTFIELVNVGDLISQMIDVFYEQQVAGPRIADRNDFLDPSGLAKKKFEQMLDESVAAGLNKGIDVLMDEVEYICATTQLPTDYNPLPPAPSEKNSGATDFGDMGPTHTARRVVELVSSHTGMLVGSTEKTMLDVFNGEVGLRLFTAVCKHLKRQRISTDGAIKLIADMNLYFDYIRKLKNNDLLDYFKALRELSQIYLIAPNHAKEMATIIADGDRFGGIFRAEEVYEFAERRADWYQVRKDVERAMYGLECCVM